MNVSSDIFLAPARSLSLSLFTSLILSVFRIFTAGPRFLLLFKLRYSQDANL